MPPLLLIPTDANSIQAWVSLAQLIITIGTLVLIISTFRLQLGTFEKQAEATDAQVAATNSQLELAKLQVELHRMELMPFLVFKEQLTITNYEWEDPNSVQQQVQFEVQKNCVKNLTLAFKSPEPALISFKAAQLETDKRWLPGEIIAFNFQYNQHLVHEEIMFSEFHDVFCEITMYYSDIVGTRYKQRFIYEPLAQPQISAAQRIIDIS